MITSFNKERVLEWIELALEFTDFEAPSINDTNEVLGYLVDYIDYYNDLDVPLHKVVIVLLAEAIKDLDSSTKLLDSVATARTRFCIDKINAEMRLNETEEELNNAYECIGDLANKIDKIKELLF